MRKNDLKDPVRRLLLRRLGLAAGLAYSTPMLTGLGRAWADDDDGGGGGSSASFGGGEGWQRPSRTSRPSRPRRRQARAAPRPEIVALIPQGQSPAPIEAAGYAVLANTPVQALAGTLLRLSLPPGRTPDQALAEIQLLLPGAFSDLNHLYSPDSFVCDSGSCDAQGAIGWTAMSASAAPRIGMIDTGINTGHHALSGQRLRVHQIDLGTRQVAGRQHGTAVAALLIGRADDRVPGLLPAAELVAVEAFHRDGSGDRADAFSLTSALDFLLREGVDVINLSLSGPENQVLAQVVRAAVDQGVALVAAAGNGGPGAAPAYPAAWPGVIAVTAVDAALNPYRQANRGYYIDLAAPGVNLWTAASVSGGRLRSGTSYAAPFVTAALAVLRLRAPAANIPDLVAELHRCARDLGDPGFDPVFGHGLLSAPEACDGQVFSVSGE